MVRSDVPERAATPIRRSIEGYTFDILAHLVPSPARPISFNSHSAKKKNEEDLTDDDDGVLDKESDDGDESSDDGDESSDDDDEASDDGNEASDIDDKASDEIASYSDENGTVDKVADDKTSADQFAAVDEVAADEVDAEEEVNNDISITGFLFVGSCICYLQLATARGRHWLPCHGWNAFDRHVHELVSAAVCNCDNY
jgi:hypothetical protein